MLTTFAVGLMIDLDERSSLDSHAAGCAGRKVGDTPGMTARALIPEIESLRQSIELVNEVCRPVGRDFDSLRLGCYLQVAVTNGDRSAREAIRGLVVTHARFSGFEPKPPPGVDEAEHSRYEQAVETMEAVYRSTRGGVERRAGGAPGEIEFYPQEAGADDLIDQFAIAGPAAYCAERLQEIVDVGISRVFIGTRAVGVDLDELNSDRIGREVLPLLR